MQAHDSVNMVLSLTPYCKILDLCGIYEYIRMQQWRSQSKETVKLQIYCKDRMFIGPCIIVIVEELETNLMSLVMFITLNICSTCFEH